VGFAWERLDTLIYEINGALIDVCPSDAVSLRTELHCERETQFAEADNTNIHSRTPLSIT